LVLETRDQADETLRIGPAKATPDLGED